MAAEIESATGVVPKMTEGSKGIFDVIRDGKLVYSKYATGRFPEEDEVGSILKGEAPADRH